MSQPLYFLPGLRASAAESIALRKGVLKERGLLDVFADVPQEQQPLQELPGRGPGGLAGCLLCYTTPKGDIPRRWGYYHKEQSWTPVGDGSLLWIGVDTAEPPTPEGMARRKQYGGYLVTIGDHEWQVPVIRRPDGTTELPCSMLWDATGKLIEPIKPAYEACWREFEEAAKWYYEGVSLDLSRGLELAVKALSLNYRFGRNEQNVLQVIDREMMQTILALTVDAPTFESQKKTVSIEPGERDCSETIDPATATSI